MAHRHGLGALRCASIVILLGVCGLCPAEAIQASTSERTAWKPDVLLEADGFWSRTLTFPDDYDGPVTATLIRRPLTRSSACAVLYLHGYIDYFFQVPLADYFQSTPLRDGRGCDFWALDLRKYGRSLREGYRFPNFAKNVDEYFPEITAAIASIHADGYTWILLNGHSTGGLIAARYLQDGPGKSDVNALFLNSPFLDFNSRDVSWAGVLAARFISLFNPHFERSSPLSRWYARSLLEHSSTCDDCHGRWTFDTRLKPLDGFATFLGWVRAIARAQARVRKGGIQQPILILHSARSLDGTGDQWHDEYRQADLVLDVKDMERDGRKIGSSVTIRSIEGGVHDLVLSDADARVRVFDEVTNWLTSLP